MDNFRRILIRESELGSNAYSFDEISSIDDAIIKGVYIPVFGQVSISPTSTSGLAESLEFCKGSGSRFSTPFSTYLSNTFKNYASCIVTFDGHRIGNNNGIINKGSGSNYALRGYYTPKMYIATNSNSLMFDVKIPGTSGTNGSSGFDTMSLTYMNVPNIGGSNLDAVKSVFDTDELLYMYIPLDKIKIEFYNGTNGTGTKLGEINSVLKFGTNITSESTTYNYTNIYGGKIYFELA